MKFLISRLYENKDDCFDNNYYWIIKIIKISIIKLIWIKLRVKNFKLKDNIELFYGPVRNI